MIQESECSKRNCVFYQGVKQLGEDDSSQFHICKAFPEGIPDNIAYGTNKHSVVQKGQKGKYIFVESPEETENTTELNFATTEAGDDWLRYGRLKTSKKKKDQKEAAAMDSSEMVTVNHQSKTKKRKMKNFLKSIGYCFEVLFTIVLTHPNQVKQELRKLKEKRNK